MVVLFSLHRVSPTVLNPSHGIVPSDVTEGAEFFF